MKQRIKNVKKGEALTADKLNEIIRKVNSLSPISTPSVVVQEWGKDGVKLSTKDRNGIADSFLDLASYFEFGFIIDNDTSKVHFRGGELPNGSTVGKVSKSVTGGSKTNPLYFYIQHTIGGSGSIKGPQSSRPEYLQGNTINIPLASFYKEGETIYLSRIYHLGMPLDIGGV